jgi:hypothetical protein
VPIKRSCRENSKSLESCICRTRPFAEAAFDYISA